MKINNDIFELGTEKAFKLLSEANKLVSKGRNIINLGIGQPDFRTPTHIVDAGIKALKDGKHGYTDSLGLISLREEISKNLYERHQVQISPEKIVILPGGKPTIFFALLLFGGKDKEIIYPDPGFPIYESLIKYSGATPIPIKLNKKNNFDYLADEIISKISDKTNLIIINSPSNPTGSIIKKEEIKKLLNELQKYPDISILSDEIYSEMLYENIKHETFLKYQEFEDRLIYLDGFSKTYSMTGWRIGYSIWPKKLIPHISKLCVNSHSCVNTISQYAAIAALTGPRNEIKRMMNEFSERRELILSKINECEKISCKKPSGAFYVFPDIKKTDISSDELQDIILYEAGVALLSGKSFGGNGEGFLRISFANSKENIEKAFYRISKIIS